MNQKMNLFDSLSEGRDTEFKSARGGVPRSLWETYSAFANTAGGFIYLGIKETDAGLEIQGVEDSDKLLRDFWSAVNNADKVNVNILADSNVEIIDVEGRDVIAIDVPRAPREVRPVYVGRDPYRGTFRRNHEGDFHCRAGEVSRMFAEKSDDTAPDRRILDLFSIEDFDDESLRQFRNRMGSIRPNHAWLSLDDQAFLERLGGWRRDRVTGQEGPTVAGLLMFGKTEAITDPEAVSGFHLDYRERLAEDETVRWSDRLTIDGTWEANLFQFFIRVSQKIHTDPALKIPFERDAHGYRKGESAVHEALQEALVNALIHADHTGEGGIVIERFLTRFEFSNPGTLLLSIEQLLTGGVSECRNKSLQKMFQMLGAGDKAGSGLDNIRSSWQAQHWQSPSLRETFRPDRVILNMPLVSMLPAETIEQLKANFGHELVAGLVDDEIQTLATAALEDRVTNRRLQEMITRHRVDITQMLRSLVERGLLVQHNRGRGAFYTVAWLSEDVAPGSLHNDTSFLHNDTSFLHNDTSFLRKSRDASHKSTGPSDGPVKTNESNLPAALFDIAAPVRDADRSNPELVKAVITALCDDRYLSLQQLSELLGRNPDGLHTRYILPLIRGGQLQRRFPDKPRHSQQAYRATASVASTP